MNIIPKPKSENKREGALNIADIKSVGYDERFGGVIPIIEQTLLLKLSINIGGISAEGTPALSIVYDEKIKPEGYALKIDEKGIKISASDSRGVLYAAQSLRILANADTKNPVKSIGFTEITDYPDNGWRGMSIDVARHFFEIKEIKKIIDLMLLHKLNVLHMHLTDDQGWRVEIKKFPLLTEIGSKREKTHIHGWKQEDHDGTPHSGYYTQEQLKDIVGYAALRGISIIPEIDMPAHFAAAFASYSYLACRDKKVEVPWYFGGYYPMKHGIKDWNRSACIGKKTTFDFIYGVIDEICELFPAPYFHIGGDEAPFGEWATCPDCQRLIREEGLNGAKELQGYFINRINDYIKKKGKKLIAWNEALKGKNLDTDVLIQYWVPLVDKNVANFLKKGGKVLMSKHSAFYFDISYSQYPLKNTYNFSPFIEGITEEYADQIVGMEGELWTEWISTADKLEFQAFPRVTALAENVWAKDGKDYGEFLERWESFKEILDALGTNYAERKIFEPKNPLKRLYRVYEWYAKNQDKEYMENKNLKGK
ncbi:MAG: beta-N-acetylhexosaminidase [Clostridiales bacterium]|jgi:hexosaminidase|nr:beta-N-acetylhexosaminidase [Clostridiales bacterium]